jgi:hypothetical protein
MVLCFLLVRRRKIRKKKKREKEKQVGAFFSEPEAGHTLLAVPSKIFEAVSCN